MWAPPRQRIPERVGTILCSLRGSALREGEVSDRGGGGILAPSPVSGGNSLVEELLLFGAGRRERRGESSVRGALMGGCFSDVRGGKEAVGGQNQNPAFGTSSSGTAGANEAVDFFFNARGLRGLYTEMEVRGWCLNWVLTQFSYSSPIFCP